MAATAAKGAAGHELAVKAKAIVKDGSVMSRPLCAYPATATWTGRGSTDDAANFACVDAQHQPGDFSVADLPRNLSAAARVVTASTALRRYLIIQR